MNSLVIRRADGGVSIVTPAPQDAEAHIAAWAGAALPAWLPVAGYRVVDTATLPASREDRNAWEDDGDTVKVSPARKAKLLKEQQQKEHDKRSTAGKADAEFDGVGSAPVGVLSGVKLGVGGTYVLSGSGGQFTAGAVSVKVGESVSLYSEGLEEVTLEVTQAGAVQVRRTRGHEVYRVKFALISL